MIKVLIVDDQEIIRESLAFMLGSRNNISVIGTAENGQEAIRQVRDHKPDIVLMDIRMPGMDGIESLKIIKEFSPDTKVLILTTFDDEQYIYDALKNGANGFLLKGVKLDELVKSIKIVVSGGASLESSIGTKVLELFSQMAKADIQFNIQEKELNELNNNELKIIQHIGQGMSNKEIAEQLNFTEGTVRNYISSILKKLDLRDRTQIAIFAIQSSIMVRTIED